MSFLPAICQSMQWKKHKTLNWTGGLWSILILSSFTTWQCGLCETICWLFDASIEQFNSSVLLDQIYNAVLWNHLLHQVESWQRTCCSCSSALWSSATEIDSRGACRGRRAVRLQRLRRVCQPARHPVQRQSASLTTTHSTANKGNFLHSLIELYVQDFSWHPGAIHGTDYNLYVRV